MLEPLILAARLTWGVRHLHGTNCTFWDRFLGFYGVTKDIKKKRLKKEHLTQLASHGCCLDSFLISDRRLLEGKMGWAEAKGLIEQWLNF